MSKTSSEDWQTLLKDWQTLHVNNTQQMFDAFGQWQKHLTPSDNTDENPASFDTTALFSNMQALTETNQALFDAIAKEYEKNISDSTQQFLFKSLSDMTQPQNWLDLSGNLFDLSAHNISEKPFVSGISDIEERLAYANDSWKNFLKDNQQYQSVVMQSWVKAYEKFVSRVKETQEEDEEKVFSPRELIDLWAGIANQELMSLHRSDHFLSAQKELLKASMEYRLHEKNIAEVLCESLHIPTRIEVDELHQSVTELKRELRKAKQRIQQLETDKVKPAPKRTASKKATASATKPKATKTKASKPAAPKPKTPKQASTPK